MVGLAAPEEGRFLEVLMLELADGAGEVVLAGMVTLWFPCDADKVAGHSFCDEREVSAQYAKDPIISGGVSIRG